MYKWNKEKINLLYNYLKTIPTNIPEVKEDLEILEMLKNREDKNGSIYETIKYNLETENNSFDELIQYDNILYPIIDKYSDENDIKFEEFKKIVSFKKDILLFTRDNIRKINPKYLEEIDKYFSLDYLDFNKGNPNITVYLAYLNKAFVSIDKENTISDFYNPTHELLHVYCFLKNQKDYLHIENEFLSILGEFITSYEMCKNNLFPKEVLKVELESFSIFLKYLKSIILKRTTIINNIDPKNKINYLKNEYNIPKIISKDIYTTSIDYNYKYIIGYLLALELFNIYLIDKEKCLHIIDKIIMSNESLEKKLKDNNINLLEHSDNYILELKNTIL